MLYSGRHRELCAQTLGRDALWLVLTQPKRILARTRTACGYRTILAGVVGGRVFDDQMLGIETATVTTQVGQMLLHSMRHHVVGCIP